MKLIDANNSKIELAIHKLTSSKQQKTKIIDKHQDILNKLCDDCKKIFGDYYNITTYLKEISDIDINLEQFNNKKIENSNKKNNLVNKINDFSAKIEKANRKIYELSEESIKTNKELILLESKINQVENDIVKIDNSENPYTELFEKNQLNIKEETNSLNELSTKYKYLKYAENIVSQDTLRKFIISDLIGLLNNKIKMYLTKFGAKYDVKFDSDMEYEFITEGGPCEYDNFSAGERARLMIAACFAFRDFMYIRNNLSSNILILDEFIDGAIDSLAIESILEILANFSKVWN